MNVEILPAEITVALTPQSVEVKYEGSGGVAPVYDGPYTVVPSDEPVVLETEGRQCRDDITVEPSPAAPAYSGPYEATPTEQTQTLETEGLQCSDDIVILPIPTNYHDTSDSTALAANIEEGYTAYINGGKVFGTLVMPSASQDQSTGILTIS